MAEGHILLRDIIDLDGMYNQSIGNIQEDRSQAAVRREKIEKGEIEATEDDDLSTPSIRLVLSLLSVIMRRGDNRR